MTNYIYINSLTSKWNYKQTVCSKDHQYTLVFHDQKTKWKAFSFIHSSQTKEPDVVSLFNLYSPLPKISIKTKLQSVSSCGEGFAGLDCNKTKSHADDRLSFPLLKRDHYQSRLNDQR